MFLGCKTVSFEIGLVTWSAHLCSCLQVLQRRSVVGWSGSWCCAASTSTINSAPGFTADHAPCRRAQPHCQTTRQCTALHSLQAGARVQKFVYVHVWMHHASYTVHVYTKKELVKELLQNYGKSLQDLGDYVKSGMCHTAYWYNTPYRIIRRIVWNTYFAVLNVPKDRTTHLCVK